MPTPLRKVQLNAMQKYIPGGSYTEANVGVPSAGVNYDAPRVPLGARRAAAAAPSRRKASPGHESPGGIDGQLDYMEKRARLLQMQAMEQPQPLRMVSGPGIVPGYMPDTLAMNGMQRQVYLPKGSDMTAVGAADDTARSDREQSEFQNFMTQTDQRRATERRGGGAAGADEAAEYAAALELARKRRGVRD